MLKKWLSLVLIAAASPGFLKGEIAEENTSPLQFTGEFLYLKPTLDDTYFVMKEPGRGFIILGERTNNSFGYEPAFRVAGAYTFCGTNRTLSLAYTRLSADKSKSLLHTFLGPTIGAPDFVYTVNDSSFNYFGDAHAKNRVLFERYDLLLSQPIFCNCNLDLALQVGVEVASMNFDGRYLYVSDTIRGLVKQSTRTNGIGPQAGLAGYYRLSDCQCFCPGKFGLTFNATGSLLGANSKMKMLNQTSPPDFSQTPTVYLDISNSKAWRVIPALHGRIGLNYAFHCDCLAGSFEVGYEVSNYFRALAKSIYPDDIGKTLAYNQYDDFALHGLYLSLGFDF